MTARKVWNTYANKRVYASLPNVDNTVYSKAGIPIDLCLIRENIEDVYGAIEHSQTNDVTQCRRLVTRPGSEQIHRYAFEVAKQRNAKRVTCGHKANIMKITDGMFLETFYKVAKEYPQLKADDVIIDDLCMKLVMQPQAFDVIVSTNLQGDIVSDLAAGLIGGLGLSPSANVGDNIVLFEAVHGTAPDIAGKQLANPTALFLSGLMMLRHIGLSHYSNHLRTALLSALKDKCVTQDLIPAGSKAKALKTGEFAEAIIERFPKELKDTTKVYFDQGIDLSRPNLKQNIMHASKRDIKTEKTVGIDVFIDSSLQPKELAATIQKKVNLEKLGLSLIMVSNRGTQVWPTGSVFTELVNHYRCRLENKKGEALQESDLLRVASSLGPELRVCSLEMLRVFGDKKGYSLAQGQ